jgi:6-pyruvoyltetrahydropterin/6-carboxytetrahydropterin synthase
MPGQFIVRVESDFAASHIIHGHQGACARLHGHNWRIEVEAIAQSLDEIGISIDFKLLKTHLRNLLDTVEHRHLNDIPPFNQINPTAENLAAWIYQQLKQQLTNTHAKLHAVIVWETDRSMVKYTEV